jgi:Kef-type K+ transport system membrane component KefB/nucleotide-binding universal stress UspA family protein/mannitol/fructose-specific phosphotransferase system IIA component (Ntr-type)
MLLPITEPAGVFAIVLAVILVAPFLAEIVKLPAIVGLAVASILVGPHGFGLIGRDGTIDFLGNIGLLYVLFSAGAEINPKELRRGRRSAAIAYFFAFVIPFAAAAVAGSGLLRMPPLPSLLLGAVIASCAIVPSPTIAKLGLGRQRSVVAASGAVLLADASAMIVLGAVARFSGTAPNGEWEEVALNLALIAAWAALSAFIIPRAAAFFFKKVKPDGTIDFVFIIALAFLCAYSARLAKLEPAIGAFFAGILLGRFIPESSLLMSRVKFVGDALLMPFFLIYVGVLADPLQVIGDAAGLRAVIVMTALCLLASAIASGGAALALGYGAGERRMFFGLTASRAAPAIAVALVGYKLGLFDRAILDGSVFLVIATCFAGTLAVRSAGKRLAAGTERAIGGGTAFERILVAVSKPSSIRGLVELAFLIRGRGSPEPVYPVAVVAASSDSEVELAAAENRLAQAVVQGVSAGVPVIPSTRVSANVSEGVLLAAQENRASAIVIGWNKAPKLSHAFFGNVIEQVLLGGTQLVVVARATKPLGAISQISLVLPLFITRHPGFARGLAALGSFISQTDARLVVYTLAGHGAGARSAMRGVNAHGSIQIVELGSWKELGADARSGNEAARAFILFSARPGEPAWHPAVEKLPHRLGEEFPEASLFLFYLPDGINAPYPLQPAEPESGEIRAEAAGGGGETAAMPAPSGDLLDRALAAGRVRPAMHETAITDGIRELLRSAFGEDRKALNKLSALFTQIAQNEPIELEPGVMLLHAHVEEVREPMVFFGARPEGFRVLALEEPVRILLILCAPVGQAPEEHLALLGEIARLFKDGRCAARLGIPAS